MAVIWQDGFDHYGDGSNARGLLTQGAYAEVNSCFVTQSAAQGARSGKGCLFVNPQSGGSFQGVRLVLPAGKSRLFVHQAIYFPQLPPDNDTFFICELRDNTNTSVGDVRVQSDGSLRICNSAGATLATTVANTIIAGSWLHFQLDWTVNAATGAVAILINNVSVLAATGLNTGATNIAQLRWRINNTNSLSGFFIDDLVIVDTTGAINNSLLGDLRVNTTFVIGNGTSQGWTKQSRFKFGTGIFSSPQQDSTGFASPDGYWAANSSDFQFTNGDYTMEGFFRWTSLPATTDQHTIFSKWRESTNERSYQLRLGGTAVNGGKLDFRISTDGQAGTVATVVSQFFTPVIGHWYHIAIQRASGLTTLFVDGVAQNAPAADANNYNTNTAVFMVGNQQSGNVSGSYPGFGLPGFFEETRITKGVARYTGGFVPPVAAYGRNVGADPSFNSVVLLAGYDNGLIDESSFIRSLTLLGSASVFQVDDSAGAFATINNQPARDDTYVEAPFIAATGFLTFTGQPANNETVTVDGNTYTFKNPFVNAAGNVLIGANVSATIDNLVAAINAGAGSGTLYGAGTTPSANGSASNIGNSIMQFTANTAGTGGNAIVTTETIANASWGAGTLTGGTNIPGPSTFTLGRLPPQTTGVRALTIVKRARKTDAGPGSVQAAFLTSNLSTANGANQALTTSLTYYQDTIEVDPNTSGALTPATFIGATVRVDRTA